jgi:hypothetical protein
MAIVQVHPEPEEAVRRGTPLFVDSDAATNAQAILEVDLWCRERGLVRARESYLRTLRTPEGVLLRRAVCYEPPLAMERQAAEEFANIRQHVAAMPETAPLAEDE